MKRIILLFILLFTVNAFACKGAFHETLEEAGALYDEGYQMEAYNLMSELVDSELFSFSSIQMECYNRVVEMMGIGYYMWVCTNCDYYTSRKPMGNRCPMKDCNGILVRAMLANR